MKITRFGTHQLFVVFYSGVIMFPMGFGAFIYGGCKVPQAIFMSLMLSVFSFLMFFWDEACRFVLKKDVVFRKKLMRESGFIAITIFFLAVFFMEFIGNNEWAIAVVAIIQMVRLNRLIKEFITSFEKLTGQKVE